MRTRSSRAAMLAWLIGNAIVCYADAVSVNGTWYNFYLTGAGQFGIAGSSNSTPPNVYANAGNPPWTFTAPAGGAVLTVLDGGHQGDVMQVYDNGQLLGATSPTPVNAAVDCGANLDACLANPNMSRGYFYLAAGAHSITIASLVFPYSPPSTLQWFKVDVAAPGSMTQFATGGGWASTIQLINTTTQGTSPTISIFGDSGAPLSVPLNSTVGSTLTQNMTGNSVFTIDSNATGATQQGWAKLTNTGAGGFVRYTYAPSGQQLVSPLETRNAGSYFLTFDNTNGFGSGVAVANISSNPANIQVNIRNNAGVTIGTSSLALQPNGHAAFILSQQFPATQNTTGTIEFVTPAGGQISVLGIRSTPQQLFSTAPSMSNADPNGGSMAHLAVGGGWSTTIELFNVSGVSANAQLAFANDNGTPLPLPATVNGSTTTTATVSQSIPAKGRVVVDLNGAGIATVFQGWANLTSDGRVTGFLRFRYTPTGQEATVPIQNQPAGSYTLAFDNTNGVATGVAIANTSPAAANAVVNVRDINGGALGAAQAITIPANGHVSFVLTDRFAATANQSGSIQIQVPTGTQLSVIGLRFPSASLFTSIPVANGY